MLDLRLQAMEAIRREGGYYPTEELGPAAIIRKLNTITTKENLCRDAECEDTPILSWDKITVKYLEKSVQVKQHLNF